MKKRWLCWCLFLLSGLASGCWDQRELERLAIVSGIGVDRQQDGENYQVTFQIIRPDDVLGGEGGAGGGGGGAAKPFWALKAEGETIFEAIRKATFESSRRIFLSHNEVLIINEAVAEEGIFPVIEFLMRDAEPRLSQWLLVTPDEAGKVLEVESKLEKIPAAGIALQLENYYATSKVRAVSLYDFAERLLKGTTANTLPMIKIIETDGEESLRLEKTAVFKEDKLVGYLDQRETRGLLWVLGEVRGGIIVLRLPGAEGKISIEISEAAAKISAAGKEQPVKLEVEIGIEAILGEQTTEQNLVSPEKIRFLEELTAEAITGEVEAALSKARQLGTDIFGFAEYLRRYHPPTWERLQDEWEKHFRRLEVASKVKTKIAEVGLTKRPVIPVRE
jgi:spore germination protein KC